jgi:DNA repair exonuclease SbcCD ATPase subunit
VLFRSLIVSHIESMRDAVDSLVEIKKEGNYSNINYA